MRCYDKKDGMDSIAAVFLSDPCDDILPAGDCRMRK